ncbi:hypothetical protein AALO_G00289580 [Alosa alosa]|uniref:Methyltransferase type 11 domain-containing protein n=1 Tax=Alosa alosa TaxID=278164 RepID=A0AAV6FJQ8_9TELE|nr:demethylmenaquinone methyltransferase isoform X1 [Alosa alosa]XP_048090950.1 demethylmenaquinone methyltransferase isoform X1 [Alosa alosa]KAG5261876.1 hypothetical protein AALO_G00289580 [Alosa alosa]
MGERRYEGKEHAYSYQKYRVSPLELVKEMLSFLQKRQKTKPFPLALDVGCGSGQGTVLLAPHFLQVVGTDISPAMLEFAQAGDHPPNVSYRQCPAEQLPFEDGTVDLLTSMTAAHWFDRPRFLLEADRVLRPGGCLALISYTMDFELECGDHSGHLNAICQEFYAALRPHRIPHLGTSSLMLYKQMYDSISYEDKEWHDCLRVRRKMPLASYIHLVETFTSYQALLQKDPQEAQTLSQDITDKLVSTMGVSSPETEVTVVVKYFYLLACKPSTK